MSDHDPSDSIRIVTYASGDDVSLRGRIQDLPKGSLKTMTKIIGETVHSLEEQLNSLPSPEKDRVGMSEVTLSFGMDFDANTKLPILGPILSAGVKAGTTFQVTAKLTRGQT